MMVWNLGLKKEINKLEKIHKKITSIAMKTPFGHDTTSVVEKDELHYMLGTRF